MVTALVLGGFAAWAVSGPGVEQRVGKVIDTIKGDVADATADAQLRRATDALVARYDATGIYSPGANGDDLDANITSGVSLDYCNPQMVVIGALTSHGRVSRLLVGGKTIGDAEGRHGCPTDADSLSAWKH